MDYSPYVNTLFLNEVTTMQYNINNRPRPYKNRPITKVCTFEVGDTVKTVCIDREGDSISTYTSKDGALITNPSGAMRRFMKTVGCRTVHYFRDDVYKYTCRTFQKGITTKTMRYDY